MNKHGNYLDRLLVSLIIFNSKWKSDSMQSSTFSPSGATRIISVLPHISLLRRELLTEQTTLI